MRKTKTDENPKHWALFFNKIKICPDSGFKKKKNLYMNSLLIYEKIALDWIKFDHSYFISYKSFAN